ncbi:MAG TPA: hypothetical protein VG900_01550 [Hyphomicrobiaceae bacterium]|nr:hypothetical protein [Hyphomicrobiaceae bacterium]
MRSSPHESEQQPLTALWWNPALNAPAIYNAKLHETLIAINGSWQTFVGQRLNEDLQLFQQIAAAKSLEQVWSTYATFWRKAAEDYARECAAIAKLASECMVTSVSVAEDAVQARPAMMPLSKAA